MKISEQTLGADIKAGKLARVYLLYGDEDFLIRMYADKLLALAVPEDGRDMNYRKYSLVPNADKASKDDRPPKIDELSDFVDSMPFFAERKCVILKNLEPDVLEKSELEDYIALINDIPETSVVIITRENTEDDPKKFREKLGKAKMKKLIEAVDANGIVCELNCFSGAKLSGMAISKCRRAGCGLSDENAAFLAQRVGGSLSLLQTEVEKLCAYRQSGEITRDDIELLVPKLIESNIYDLAKELFAGRVGNALEILDALFIQRAEPVVIMAALSGHFVDLYCAKLGQLAKKSYSDAAAALNYGRRAFVMRNAYGAVKNLSAEYLADCIAILYNANKQLNSSKADKRQTIEKAIVEIAARR